MNALNKIYLSKLVMAGAEILDKPISDDDVEYIRADVIRTEIERRITDNTFGAKLELIDILAWLDTLESEKPMEPEGLEDILLEFYDEYDSNVENRPLIPRIYAEKLARHFAEWGAEQFRDTTKKIEPPCHTVEEWIEHIKNADQLTKDIFSEGPYDVLYDALNHPYRDCYDAIKEFGELCYQTARQDMMNEAVVYVAEPETPIGNILMPFIRIDHSVLFRYGIKVGDKVKIIIVKQD